RGGGAGAPAPPSTAADGTPLARARCAGRSRLIDGSPMPSSPAFDVATAVRHLAEHDDRLARLIAETRPFELALQAARSPYEALLEAITYQSISGKAAATIFARVKALGGNGHLPPPAAMLALRAPTLRQGGLPGAEGLGM